MAPVERKGIDLVFAIDVSESMNAQDVKPSRLEKAKFEISQMIDQLQGCLLYTSPSPRDGLLSRMPSSA